MDEKNKGTGIGEFPRSWMNKKEENSQPKGIYYFLAFVIWIPIAVTVVRFWWDFFNWLVI